MNSIKFITLNSLLLIFLLAVLYFLPILNFASAALVTAGVCWQYLYFRRERILTQKKNRFSLYWFVMKFFGLVDKASNKYAKKLFVILIPYMVLYGFKQFIGAQVNINAYLIGVVLFEVYFVIRLLLGSPNSK